MEFVRTRESLRRETPEPGLIRTVGRALLLTAAVSSIAAPVLACWVGGIDFVVLLGHDVLPPATVALILWSFGVLVGAGLVMICVAPLPGSGLRQRRRSVLFGCILSVTLLGTGVWCLGEAVVIEGTAALGKNAYTVVRAPDRVGCTLVAHEVGGLRITDGRLYAVGPLGYGQPAASWRADEIQLPVHDGTFSTSWDGDVGTLSLHGSRAVMPDRLRVICP